ncbi:hypothetical protein EOA30_17795 [Mesorhizobium sp. M8A.F.Ca.ET.059.01.1.1]|nr:hypothetical protein EOA30_17795 [Mesorhizobium sp. M8A.F.Ca.ET.059.01.1.1]
MRALKARWRPHLVMRGNTEPARVSNSKVARMKKRCADVLTSEGTYDRDLRQLCLLIGRPFRQST